MRVASSSCLLSTTTCSVVWSCGGSDSHFLSLESCSCALCRIVYLLFQSLEIRCWLNSGQEDLVADFRSCHWSAGVGPSSQLEWRLWQILESLRLAWKFLECSFLSLLSRFERSASSAGPSCHSLLCRCLQTAWLRGRCWGGTCRPCLFHQTWGFESDDACSVLLWPTGVGNCCRRSSFLAVSLFISSWSYY